MAEKSELLSIISKDLQGKFNLSKQAIEDIFSRAVINDIKKEELLFRQGVKSKFLFFIIEGKAEIIRDNQIIAEVKKGDIVGEMSMIGKGKASATVKAITDMMTFKFQKEKFSIVLNKYPSLNKSVVLEAINRKNEQNDIDFS